MSVARRGGVDRYVVLSGGAGDPELIAGTADPSVGAGIAAPEGSIFLRFVAGGGQQYIKQGAAATSWVESTAGLPLGRTVYVDKNQTISAPDGSFAAPFPTIAAGLAAAVALTPSTVAQVAVVVAPGLYAEAPLTVPSGVVLVSVAPSQFSVTIVATVPTSPLVTVAPGSEFRGFIVTGADGVGGIGVLDATPGGVAIVREIIASDCTVDFHVTAAAEVNAAFLTAQRAAPADAGTTGFLVDAGGVLECATALCRGSLAAPFVDGVLVSGVGSRVTLGLFQSNDNEDSIHVDDGALAEIDSGAMKRNVNAMHIGSTGTGGTIKSFSMSTAGNKVDILIDGANGTWFDSMSVIEEGKRTIAAGATLAVASLSDSPITGDRALSVLAELHVGSDEFPRESVFGEGDSHVRGMVALKSTVLDAGPFVDVTVILSSPTGSSVAAFTTGAVSNALFIGGDVPFNGIKVNTLTAIALGAGALVVEISNGVGGWIPIKICTCDANAPYLSHAQDLFGRVASEQVRFGSTAGWAAQLINAVSKFWLRISVSGAALAINPVLESNKIGTNRTEINSDGIVEFFGTAEPTRQMLMHQRLTDDLAGSSPANRTIFFSANIDITPIDNAFIDGVIDGIGHIVTVPEGLDTSMPVTLSARWAPSVNSGGDVEFETDLVAVKIGDTLNGTLPEVSQAVIQTVAAGQLDVLREVSFAFDVKSLVPGDQFAFSLFRNATGANPDDTLAGNVEISSMRLIGKFWR